MVQSSMHLYFFLLFLLKNENSISQASVTKMVSPDNVKFSKSG